MEKNGWIQPLDWDHSLWGPDVAPPGLLLVLQWREAGSTATHAGLAQSDRLAEPMSPESQLTAKSSTPG